MLLNSTVPALARWWSYRDLDQSCVPVLVDRAASYFRNPARKVEGRFESGSAHPSDIIPHPRREAPGFIA
jgi:hypothetical protein